MIPDEAVEAAARALAPRVWGPQVWQFAAHGETPTAARDRVRKESLEDARRALVAAAPHLAASLADEREGDLFRFTLGQREWLRKGRGQVIPDEAVEAACTCTAVDPKYWTTHYGAVEPGSAIEPDLDCRVHFTDEERTHMKAHAPGSSSADCPCKHCRDFSDTFALDGKASK